MNVYGIKNCNSVKKALDWLTENGIAYTFHDFKKEGVTEVKLKEWEAAVGWETLLNRRGTTWRNLDPDTQAQVVDGNRARSLMVEQTSIIKRPVIETDAGEILVGFDAQIYEEKLKKN